MDGDLAEAGNGEWDPRTEDFLTRHGRQLVEVMDEILDADRFQKILGNLWNEAAREFQAKVSVIISPRPESRAFQGEYLVDGEMCETLPVYRNRSVPNRWTASPEMSVAVLPKAVQVFPRDVMETHVYPSGNALEFYSMFSYADWIDFPIRVDGRSIAKISFMRSAATGLNLEFYAQRNSTLRQLKTRWLLNRRLSLLREKLVRADREHIADDLHDSLIGGLTGIVMQAESAFGRSEENGSAALRQIRRLAVKTLEDARCSISLLDTCPAAAPTLAAIFRGLAADMRIPGRVRCRALFLGPIPSMERDAINDLSRIARESVANAIRHGGAANIVIRLHGTARHLTLTISDDGGGLLPGCEHRPGMGSRSMAKRACGLGGRLRMIFAPGRGTKVCVRIPLPRSKPSPFSMPPLRIRNGKSRGIRILIADDHPIVQAGISEILGGATDMDVVGRAADGDEVLRLMPLIGVDILLLDIRMPGADSLAILHEVGMHHPSTRVIILSGIGAEETITQHTEAGARGFLLKGGSREELLEAIRTVHRGKSYFGKEVLGKIGSQLGRPKLSRRELEVIRAAASGQSNREVATTLGLEVGTVKKYLKSIFAKLGVNSRTQAAHRARCAGWLSEPLFALPAGLLMPVIHALDLEFGMRAAFLITL